jgi:hypothetical protein
MDIYSESTSWMWGMSLIGATIIIHAIGVVSMALGMSGIPLRLKKRNLGLRYVMPTVIGVVAVIGLLLMVLHGIEAATWAAAYRRLGALDSASAAMLFSLGAMTTVGAPGLVLQPQWQMMGVLEAANGALLFGISTAYMFGVMQVYWPLLHPSTT